MRKQFKIFILALFIISTFVLNSHAAPDILFTLVNADSNSDLYELDDNDSINLSLHSYLNVRADVTYTNVDRIVFKLDGDIFWTESVAPYTLAGDDTRGDYYPWTPSTGTHTLQAIVYNNSGTSVGKRTIRFTVTSRGSASTTFSKKRGDLISLHYDSAGDPDDGHSCAADRTIASKLRLLSYIHVVNGTYGTGLEYRFQPETSKIMNAAWGENKWISAYNNWEVAVNKTAEKFKNTLDNDGHVWIKEGGPSNFTADVLRNLHDAPNNVSRKTTQDRIHTICHGNIENFNNGILGFNFKFTKKENLDYVKANTDFILVGDGNSGNNGTADLAVYRNDPEWKNETISAFMSKVKAHKFAGPAWEQAFEFWKPFQSSNNYGTANDCLGRKNNNGEYRSINYPGLDFSDTVELLYIVQVGVDKVANPTDFANAFFVPK